MAREQRLHPRDEILDAHALAPGEAPRLRHVAAQADGIVDARRNRIDGHQIAVAQIGLSAGCIQLELVDRARLVVFDALDRGFLARGRARQPPRPGNQIGQRAVFPEFENRRHVDAAGYRHQGADRRDVDHVSRQERRILGFVATDQEIVQVEFGDHLVAALQLDAAHRALGRRPARGEHGIHQSAHGTDGVGTRAARLADDEHLNRAQLA